MKLLKWKKVILHGEGYGAKYTAYEILARRLDFIIFFNPVSVRYGSIFRRGAGCDYKWHVRLQIRRMCIETTCLFLCSA